MGNGVAADPCQGAHGPIGQISRPAQVGPIEIAVSLKRQGAHA